MRERVERFRVGASLLSALAVAALSGCASALHLYPGHPRPKEEIAVIEPFPRILFVWVVYSVDIVSVDGHELGVGNISAEVLPGHHVVTVARGSGVGKKERVDLAFDAQAGHVYQVDGKDLSRSPFRVALWMVDAADKSVVAGTPPPDVE